MDWTLIATVLGIAASIATLIGVVVTVRRRRSGAHQIGTDDDRPVSAGSSASSITQSTVIQDSEINIGQAAPSPSDRDLGDLLKLTKLEISSNMKSSGFSASTLLTVALDETRRHRDYASFPPDLIDVLDRVYRAAMTVGRQQKWDTFRA